jgi:hypothetical protein
LNTGYVALKAITFSGSVEMLLRLNGAARELRSDFMWQ